MENNVTFINISEAWSHFTYLWRRAAREIIPPVYFRVRKLVKNIPGVCFRIRQYVMGNTYDM